MFKSITVFREVQKNHYHDVINNLNTPPPPTYPPFHPCVVTCKGEGLVEDCRYNKIIKKEKEICVAAKA